MFGGSFVSRNTKNNVFSVKLVYMERKKRLFTASNINVNTICTVGVFSNSLAMSKGRLG